MAKDFTSFSTKLKSIIDELVSLDDTQPFAASYENAEPDPDNGWPVVMLNTLDGSTETRFSSFENMLSMNFEIRGLWPTENTTAGIANVHSAIDKMLEKFRTFSNADNLAGEVDKFSIVSIDMIEQDRPVPLFGFSITVNGQARKTLIT